MAIAIVDVADPSTVAVSRRCADTRFAAASPVVAKRLRGRFAGCAGGATGQLSAGRRPKELARAKSRVGVTPV
jgi:hypothetical protein